MSDEKVTLSYAGITVGARPTAACRRVMHKILDVWLDDMETTEMDQVLEDQRKKLQGMLNVHADNFIAGGVK